MTAMVQVAVSKAGQPGRRGHARQAWWCSLLAVLALHAVLVWRVVVMSSAAEAAPAPPAPMVVVLAPLPQASPRPARATPQASLQQRTPPAALKTPSMPPPLQPLVKALTVPTSPMAASPAPLPSPDPASPNVAAAPVVSPKAAVSAEPTPQAAPPMPASVSALVPAPGAHSVPVVPATATPGVTTSSANSSAQAGANIGDNSKGPVEMPSAAISYLVQPVLTFPPGSEELGESGSVTLRVLVDEQGVPGKVERLKSSGFPRLDQQATSVIRRARFVPHKVKGEPRAAWATVTLNFVLR